MSQVILIDEIIKPIYELAEKYQTINFEYQTNIKNKSAKKRILLKKRKDLDISND